MDAGIINGARQGFIPTLDDPQAPEQAPPQGEDTAALAGLTATLAAQKNAAVLAAVQSLKTDGQTGPGSTDAQTAAGNAAASVPAFSLTAPPQMPLSGTGPDPAPATATPAVTDPGAGTGSGFNDLGDTDPASQTTSGQADGNTDAYNDANANSNGTGNPPAGSDVKPLHPINNIADKTILNGRADPVDYATASVDRDNKVINVAVKVNYEKTFILNPMASRVSDGEYQRLVNLADAGMEKYWSRTVTLDGQQWQVHVTAVNDKDGMPITVAHPGWKIFGDLSDRSYNAWPLHEGTIYYLPELKKNSDPDFSLNAAHEIGHSFLTDAFGIPWSWGHENTSSILGGMHSDAAPYPTTGEIGLMPYYGGLPSSYQDLFDRSIASENDVKTLLYIAGRRN